VEEWRWNGVLDSVASRKISIVCLEAANMADKLKKFGMKAQAKGAMLTASVKGKMKKDKSPTPADGEEATEGVPEVEVTEPQQSAPDEEGYTSANEDTEHPDRYVIVADDMIFLARVCDLDFVDK
jgi:hypothetical protein